MRGIQLDAVEGQDVSVLDEHHAMSRVQNLPSLAISESVLSVTPMFPLRLPTRRARFSGH